MRALRRDKILALAIGGAAAAARGTVPLHRLPRPVQIAYVAVPGALTAILTYAAEGPDAQSRDGDPDAAALTAGIEATAQDAGQDTGPVAATMGESAAASGSGRVDEQAPVPLSRGARLGLSVALATLTTAAGAAWIWMDHRGEDALRAREVPAPRLVIGMGTGVVTAVFTALTPDEADHGGRSRA